MINEIALHNYFKNLAETSKALAHVNGKKSFYRMQQTDLEEFDNALKNFAAPKGLILELGTGKFGTENNVVDHAEIALFFVIKTDGKYENMDAARQDAKLIAKQFIARIKYDCMDEAFRTDNQPGPLLAMGVKFDNSGNYLNLGNLGGDGLWTGKKVDINLYGKGDTDNAYHPEEWSWE